jgi:hypothetical protein
VVVCKINGVNKNGLLGRDNAGTSPVPTSLAITAATAGPPFLLGGLKRSLLVARGATPFFEVATSVDAGET